MIGVGVAAAIAVGGAAAAAYVFLNDEDEARSYRGRRHVSSRPVSIDVRIGKEFAGVVIGKGGDNVREIQARTNTRIHFKDEQETESHRVLCIKGSPEDAQLAEILVQQTIANQAQLETLVLTVPGYSIGYIIGTGGDTVREIQHLTKCKVDVERSSGKKSYEVVFIKL